MGDARSLWRIGAVSDQLLDLSRFDSNAGLVRAKIAGRGQLRNPLQLLRDADFTYSFGRDGTRSGLPFHLAWLTRSAAATSSHRPLDLPHLALRVSYWRADLPGPVSSLCSLTRLSV